MSNKNKILVGKKLGMTQIIDESGKVIPITVVQAFENEIVNLKTIERDGYVAVSLGYNLIDSKKASKPKSGQFKGKNVYKNVKEFRVDSTEGFELNSNIDLDTFEINSKFNVRAKSIGRGFSGSVKRWGHKIGPKAHGSKSHRLIGSIGQSATPSKVIKGKRMHGRYGGSFITVKNLELIKKEDNCFFFKGAIPGKKNVVYITGV